MRNVVKLLSLKTLAVAVSVLLAGSVVSCKKDSEGNQLLKDGQPQMMGATGNENPRPYPQYENYTPPQNTWQAKLQLINNCVNNPDENDMLNMELKEAVWFLEAYFNLGVCQWQKHSPACADMQETYTFTVPLATTTSTLSPIIYGDALREGYVAMLQDIVTNIFPEYAVNFGDVFVKNINLTEGFVTIGMDILYGDPFIDAEMEPAPMPPDYPCLGTPMYGRLITTDMSLTPVFLTKLPISIAQAFPLSYNVGSFMNSETKDICMIIALNQKRTWQVPMGIKSPELWTKNSPNNFVPQYYVEKNLYGHSTLSFDITFYNDPWWNQTENFCTIYRNHIWQVLKPQLPAGSIPLEAECKLKCQEDKPSSGTANVWHDWGIKRTCTHFIPPCFIEDLHYYLVSD